MTDQEIKQLKVISLNTSQGNLDTALAIYQWLIQKTTADGLAEEPSVPETDPGA